MINIIQAVDQIYKKKRVNDRGVVKVLKNLEEIGARYFCEKQAKDYYEMALGQMKKLPIKEDFPGHYQQLSEFLIKRDF